MLKQIIKELQTEIEKPAFQNTLNQNILLPLIHTIIKYHSKYFLFFCGVQLLMILLLIIILIILLRLNIK